MRMMRPGRESMHKGLAKEDPPPRMKQTPETNVKSLALETIWPARQNEPPSRRIAQQATKYRLDCTAVSGE
jgi:hypothetical protein